MSHTPDAKVELPVSTNRVCTICGATVAAWPEVMVCHCYEMPWKLTEQSDAVMGEDVGVPAAPSGHSAEPEPEGVSALRASVPNADETVLLVADRDKPLAYLELDDATLGRFARWLLLETQRANMRSADLREMPEVVSTAMHAKIALIRLYVAVFGTCDHVWDMTMEGVEWAGMPDGGDWRITVQRLPASAIEARRAETQGGSVGDESAVVAPSDETPEPSSIAPVQDDGSER